MACGTAFGRGSGSEPDRGAARELARFGGASTETGIPPAGTAGARGARRGLRRGAAAEVAFAARGFFGGGPPAFGGSSASASASMAARISAAVWYGSKRPFEMMER